MVDDKVTGDRVSVEKAARKAGVHETIAALPHGYDTVLSRWLAEEGQGADLSAGEWQKLTLARLFVREKANLLILDEPTAALDAQAEYDVYSRFVELVNGRTFSAPCACPMRLPCWKMGGLWSAARTLNCAQQETPMPG
jgi:ATP-binding cassette subfamily B protein